VSGNHKPVNFYHGGGIDPAAHASQFRRRYPSTSNSSQKQKDFLMLGTSAAKSKPFAWSAVRIDRFDLGQKAS
jgi:hypothetical protein